MKTKHLREITNDNCLHPVTNSNLKAWVAWDDGTIKCTNVLGDINQGHILSKNSS